MLAALATARTAEDVRAVRAFADQPAEHLAWRRSSTLSQAAAPSAWRAGALVCVAGHPTTVQERIFDPFFTTRESGQGTGPRLTTRAA